MSMRSMIVMTQSFGSREVIYYHGRGRHNTCNELYEHDTNETLVKSKHVCILFKSTMSIYNDELYLHGTNSNKYQQFIGHTDQRNFLSTFTAIPASNRQEKCLLLPLLKLECSQTYYIILIYNTA